MIAGFGAIAWATGVEATAMKAELIDSRAEVSSRLANPPEVPETLTKWSSPSGLNGARTWASSAPST